MATRQKKPSKKEIQINSGKLIVQIEAEFDLDNESIVFFDEDANECIERALDTLKELGAVNSIKKKIITDDYIEKK